MTSTSDEIQREGARMQSLFREVNERTEELTTPSIRLEFLCECARPGCVEPIAITLEEYDAIRQNSRRFPIKPGHEDQRLERVVSDNERFAVVEKQGAAGETAEQLDPRRRNNHRS